jgi:hypothetical protein
VYVLDDFFLSIAGAAIVIGLLTLFAIIHLDHFSGHRKAAWKGSRKHEAESAKNPKSSSG